MPWTVVTLGAVVDAEIAALPADMRARLVRMTELIEQIGFDALPRNSVKHGISRAIYVAAVGQRVVILRVFVKKTEDARARA
jgi:plasmid stabilization system protein ParE